MRCAQWMVLLLVLGVFSCKKTPDPAPMPPLEGFPPGEGVFLLSEGNYTYGNASISYYNQHTKELEEEVFLRANGRPLGDVLQSVLLHEGSLYLIVNNSGTIEVVHPGDMRSRGTISGLLSPRYLLPIGGQRAYVTDLYDDGISIIDLNQQKKTGHIELQGWTEELALFGDIAWVTNRKSSYIYLIDTRTDHIQDSLRLTYNCNAVEVDANGRLWVLCSGDQATQQPAALFCVDPTQRRIHRQWAFPDYRVGNWPRIAMSPDRKTVYYLRVDAYAMDIQADALPQMPFIPADGRLLYALDVHPVSGHIWLGDAIDYQQNGVFYEYSPNGNELGSVTTGVIPNGVVTY